MPSLYKEGFLDTESSVSQLHSEIRGELEFLQTGADAMVLSSHFSGNFHVSQSFLLASFHVTLLFSVCFLFQSCFNHVVSLFSCICLLDLVFSILLSFMS
jgi:hypothetical protein